MSVTAWRVATPYDGNVENHWQSQERIRSAFANLGGKWDQLKWRSAQTVPANWLGWTVDNPGPGYTTYAHFWHVYDEDLAMMFHLVCGNSIEKVEEA